MYTKHSRARTAFFVSLVGLGVLLAGCNVDGLWTDGQAARRAQRASLQGAGGDEDFIDISVAGLLGNSASPLQDLDTSNLDDLIPATTRGEIVVQSAGTNGLYLGTKERASKIYDAETNGLRYGMIYYTSGSTRRIDASGTTGSADLIDGFDDVILSFGN